MLALLSWSPTAAAAPQPERAWEHTRALVADIGPRPAGSPAARAAADYAAEHFIRLGLAVVRVPVGHRTIPSIEVAGTTVMRGYSVDFADDSVVATLPATTSDPGPAILVMAHVDTVAASPGAVDNAAAVGVLLELARALAETETRPHPIVFAATAAEEHGLAGARALAETYGPGTIGLALSMDLLGPSGPLTLNGLSRALGQPWLRRLTDAAARAGVAIEAPLTHQVVSRLAPQMERSDHGAFTERGVAAFHLYHRGPGRIYLPYHRSADTLEHVDAAAVAAALAFVHALVLDPTPLPDAPGPGATLLPVAGAWLVADRWLWAFELVLLVVCVLGCHRAARGALPWRIAGRTAALACTIVAGAWLATIALESLLVALQDHRQPWIHAVGRWAVTLVLITGALLAAASSRWLTTRAELARASLPLAIAAAALPGALLLWFDVVELAWLPLLHAAGLAALAWIDTSRRRALVLGLALLPAWALLDPAFLREASFHGFLPTRLPLSVLAAVALGPASVAALPLLAAVGPTPRVRRLALATAAAAVLALGASLAVGLRCQAAAFAADGLACELPRAATR